MCCCTKRNWHAGVVVRDHGHVEEGVCGWLAAEKLAHRLQCSVGQGGRFEIAGQQVTGLPRIVAPWSETLRYAPKAWLSWGAAQKSWCRSASLPG
jgi:hypothetical protein